MPSKAVMLYVPCPDEKMAADLSHKLLDAKLIACANIIPAIRSIYMWEGKKEEGSEAVLIIKSIRPNLEKLKTEISRLHIYECPCILEIEVASLNREYEDWLLDTMKAID